MKEQLFTTNQICKSLGIARTTLIKWSQDSKIGPDKESKVVIETVKHHWSINTIVKILDGVNTKKSVAAKISIKRIEI